MKRSFLYFIGHLLSRAQVFFLVPILVRYLDNELLGVYEILGSLSVFVVTLTVFSLDSCLVSFYNEQKNIKKKSEVFCASIGFSFIISFFVFIGFFFFQNYLMNKLSLSRHVSPFCFLLNISSSILSGWTSIFLVLFRLRFESLKFTLVTVLGPFSALFLTLYMLRNLVAIESVVYATFFSNILTFIVCVFVAKKSFIWVKPKYSYWISRFLKIILPLIPFSFSAWTLNLADREILVRLRGFSDAGVYGVLNRISNLTGALLGPFQISWTPYAMASWERDFDCKDRFLRVFKYFFLVSFIIIFFLFIFSDFIIKIFSNSSYVEFAYLLAPLSICNVLGAAYYFPLVSFLKEKKMLGSTVAFSVGAFLNVFFNFMLIPYLGILGAVVANLVGYSAMFLVAGHFEHSLTKIGYLYKRITFLSLLIAFIVVLAGRSYFSLNPFERMSLVLLLSSLFVVFIFCFTDVTKKEIIDFFRYFKSRISARSNLP